MKKSLLFSLVILLAALVTSVVLLTSGNDPVKTEIEKPQVLSITASVSIPERMTFAGEEIVFDRYDKRERMDRELNSFTYFHSTTVIPCT
jgi:membrane-bound lytic murein transglycosylase D